ncbi:hypothetical protein thalar_03297 [Litoreibacter arenae DSM 19593]|uniref:Uncharacterized protein n=1 Tax=Litoreibacter arenae DSM 19593 TaxID=1123360 RepID=S9QCB8_9RHOB|nr:hypothetical protein thalar_03297 [Litoreibacter arenae DSM 19593]
MNSQSNASPGHQNQAENPRNFDFLSIFDLPPTEPEARIMRVQISVSRRP